MNKTTSKADVYGKFASVYDDIGGDHFSVDMVAYTERIIKRHKIKAVSLLDLCCGTGSAMKLFADSGLSVSGLDGSSSMLKQARIKLKDYNPELYHQTLPSISIRESKLSNKAKKFDLITCYYDSLNYLKNERELQATFRSVYRHLKPGGYFIFDMNTIEALKMIWGSQIWGDVKDDLSWIFLNNFDEKNNRATLSATFFKRKGKVWQRFDEQHIEKAYPNSEIKKMLYQAKFNITGFYRCFSFQKPTDKTTRICVVAKRQR